MIKKYLPIIFLIAAAVLLYWVKTHQGGKPAKNITIAEEPAKGFERDSSNIIYSRHAKCRMECRHIDESEVREILRNGSLNYDKVEKSSKGFSYPLEGYTHDQQHVRIVFAPHHDTMVVVTVIDLDNEWACNCK